MNYEKYGLPELPPPRIFFSALIGTFFMTSMMCSGYVPERESYKQRAQKVALEAALNSFVLSELDKFVQQKCRSNQRLEICKYSK